MPMDRSKYPDNWEDIAGFIKAGAGWACRACRTPNEFPGKVLTVHHIDHDTMNSGRENLIALCQSCHMFAESLRPQPTTYAECLGRLQGWIRSKRQQQELL